MKYLTTCPHCESLFRLTVEQLDAAAGWVQCSVCGAAFDARSMLTLEDGSPVPPEPAPFEPEPAAGVETLAEAEPLPPSPIEAEAAGIQPPVIQEHASMPVGITQREAALELPSIILIEPELPVPEDMGPLPQIPAPPPVPQTKMPSPPAARIEYARPAIVPGSAPRRIKPWVWGISSALLGLLLAAQLAWFLRDTLVNQVPELRPGYQTVCAQFGCTLALPKNKALIQIVGSDLQAESPGKLKLKLTLGNRAPYALAWPVLVLTLTDRNDRPQTRRSFAPSEYLSDAGQLETGIPAQTEVPLALSLEVRDLPLAGYHLDIAY